MSHLTTLLTTLLPLCALAQEPSLVTDIDHAKWQHDSDDPPGGESSILRMDRQTGAMEFLARYPAGFAFKTHSHKANERFVLLLGRARVESGATTTEITSGGFAYFPKGTPHSITCTSETPCTFYLYWDAKP
jgi:mannose-6-phosphate isomerase-like protein (cupin superfamily)